VSAALIVSGVVGLNFTYEESKAARLNLQREKAEAAATRIQTYVQEIERQLGWMRLVPAAQADLGQRRLDYLKLLRQVPAITDVSMLDATGRERLRMSRLGMNVTGTDTDFSSDEKLAGQQAGEKAKAAGATKILCTIQQTGSVALEDRCAGVKSAFPETENIQVNGQDDSAVTSSIQAKLAQDKDINWIITLGAAQALDAVKAIKQEGANAKIGTFDTNPEAAQAVQDGQVQFFIDQQPYLQGYLSIMELYLFKRNGNILGGGEAVLTGPSFVDKTNIAQILPFVKANTR